MKGIAKPIKPPNILVLKNNKNASTKINVLQIILYGAEMNNLKIIEIKNIKQIHKYLCFLSVFILSKTRHILT